MALEQALGIKLSLYANLGNAAQQLRGELDAVATSLRAVRDLGKQFDLSGLQQLNNQVTSLNARATSAAEKVAGLSSQMVGVAAKSKEAAAGIDATAAAAGRVDVAAGAATRSVMGMGASITRAKEAGTGLSILYTGFTLIEESANAARGAVNGLTESVLRLMGIQRLALPGQSVYASRYGAISGNNSATEHVHQLITAGVIPGVERPPIFIPGGMPYALWGGGSRYIPIPQPSYRSAATAALTGEERLAITGGTNPTYNNRAWYANQRGQGTSAGSGPPIVMPPGGFGSGAGGAGFGGMFGNAAKSVKMFGDQMQSAGWALAVNGGMLAAALVPAIKTATDIDDLLHRTYEALKAGGASDTAAKQFMDATRRIPREIGSNYRETVGAGYNFISAMPAGLNLNDPKIMAVVIEGYKRAAMMQVAGASSTHPISMEEASLDVNNVIANLGFNTSTADKLAKAYRASTNLLINLKNRTSTEVDLAAASIRGIGPLAKEMNIDPAIIAGLIGMEAEGKVRGATAGYAIKRLLQRQSVPSKKTMDLINMVHSMGGDIALFDKQGKTRSLFDVMSDTTKFEDSHHITDKNKALIQGQLAGLYAIGNLDLMQDQIRKHGGAPGALKYGQSLLHGTIAGGKTGDATTDSYTARATGNVKVAASKVGADFLDTLYKTFKDIQPFLTSFLKNIDGLINAFDRLPKPVKDFAAEALIMATTFSLIAGGSAILLGNFVRLTGVLLQVGAGGAKFVGFLNKIGVIGRIGALFGSVGEIIGGGFARALGVGSIAVRALGIAFLGVPIIGWIAGLITVGTLLYEAWTHDWGGIREKTHAVLGWLGGAFHGAVGAIGSFINTSREYLMKFGPYLLLALGPIGVILAMFNPKFRKSAADFLTNLILGAESMASNVLGWFEKLGQRVLDVIKHWVTGALSAGKAFLDGFVHGITGSVGASVTAVKGAAQKIRDQFPGSEPKDSSSPLYGMGRSGQAFSDNFINGVLDGFRNGDRVKKGAKSHIKKPVMDTLVELHNESIAQVEKTAKAIEDSLTRAGAKIKMQWITLLSGGHAERFYGNTRAVSIAAREDKGRDTAGEAYDYIKRLGEFPHTYEQVMVKLHSLILRSTSEHTISLIDSMITHLKTQHERLLTSLEKEFKGATGTTGLFGSIDRSFSSEGKQGTAFDALQQKDDSKLQQLIALRNNQELPTIKELNKELLLEITEQTALAKIYTNEIDQKTRLETLVKDALTKAEAINATDAQSIALKQSLVAQAKAYQDQLDTLNDRLTNQQIILKNLNTSIDTYTTKIRAAGDSSAQWASILSDAFSRAGQDALKALGDSISNGMDSLLQRVFGAKRKGIAGFIGSFFADIFGNVVNSIVGLLQTQASTSIMSGITGWLNKIFNLGPATSSTSTASTATGHDALASAYSALMNSNKPQKVQLTDSGGVDLSQKVSDDLHTTASGISEVSKITSTIADASKKGGATSATDQSSAGGIEGAINKFLKTETGKIISGLAGAFAGYEMATAPGGNLLGNVMGAATTYESVASMFSGGAAASGGAGPYVAAAAALFTLLSHHDNPAAMPDKYNTQVYGQGLANLQGSGINGFPVMNANGQQFSENPTVSSSLGGVGELQYITQWIAANQAQAASLMSPQMLAMFSGLNYSAASGPITGGKDGNLILSNGQTVNWQNLVTAAGQAVTAIQAFGSNAVTAAQNANALAASFTSLLLGGPAGFQMPILRVGSGTPISPPAPILNPTPPPPPKGEPISTPPGQGGSGNPGDGTGPVRGGGGRGDFDITISILPNANINGDPASIQDAIQKALPALSDTITQIVTRASYRDSRLRGNYASVVS